MGLHKPFPSTRGDRQDDGTYLVSLADRPRHSDFRPVNADPTVRTATAYVVNFKAKYVLSLLTVTAEGHRIGWDTCGACQCHMTRCRCTDGITPPRWIVSERRVIGVGTVTDAERDAILARRQARATASAESPRRDSAQTAKRRSTSVSEPITDVADSDVLDTGSYKGPVKRRKGGK